MISLSLFMIYFSLKIRYLFSQFIISNFIGLLLYSITFIFGFFSSSKQGCYAFMYGKSIGEVILFYTIACLVKFNIKVYIALFYYIFIIYILIEKSM